MFKCHKINLNRDWSYTDSPDWIKDKKATKSPINKEDNKYFQNAVKFALNDGEVKEDLQRRTKIKPFINKCNWEGVNFPS